VSEESSKEKKRFSAADVLAAVTYKDWTLKLHYDPARATAPYIQWMFTGKCSKTGAVGPQFSRKWYISPWMAESELVQTAFKAALTAEEHETREHFKYFNKRVFNPHIHVRELMQICDFEDARQ
jgi:hypothetical protein